MNMGIEMSSIVMNELGLGEKLKDRKGQATAYVIALALHEWTRKHTNKKVRLTATAQKDLFKIIEVRGVEYTMKMIRHKYDHKVRNDCNPLHIASYLESDKIYNHVKYEEFVEKTRKKRDALLKDIEDGKKMIIDGRIVVIKN